MPRLEEVQKQLSVCEKALNDFMESKRAAFPRFHFVSPADLLDILSNGNNPKRIMKHMPKIFQAIETLKLTDESTERPSAIGMESCVGTEYVDFTQPMKLVGKVETYLADVIDIMRKSLKTITERSVKNFQTMGKLDWIKSDPTQVTLLVNMCNWVTDVETTFGKLGSDKAAMRTSFDKQVVILTELVRFVRGDLDRTTRTKIMCLITMDTHSRDIIDKLDVEKVGKQDEFQW